MLATTLRRSGVARRSGQVVQTGPDHPGRLVVYELTASAVGNDLINITEYGPLILAHLLFFYIPTYAETLPAPMASAQDKLTLDLGYGTGLCQAVPGVVSPLQMLESPRLSPLRSD